MDYADLPKARAPRRGSTKPAAWPASAIASAVSTASTRPVRPQWPRPSVSPRLDDARRGLPRRPAGGMMTGA